MSELTDLIKHQEGLTDCGAVAPERSGPFFNTSSYNTRVDYIWASPAFIQAWSPSHYSTVEMMNVAGKRDLSDHNLIMCEFMPQTAHPLGVGLCTLSSGAAAAAEAAADADAEVICSQPPLVDDYPPHTLYGIPLEVAAARSDPEGLVPSPVRKCIAYLIDNQLLGTEGLTRSPGSNTQKKMFIQEFDSDYNFDFPPGVSGLTIASVLLAFFMQLKNADGEPHTQELRLICMCCA